MRSDQGGTSLNREAVAVLVIMAAVFVMMVVVFEGIDSPGTGSPGKPSFSEEPTPRGEYQEYQDPDLGIRLRLPSHWALATDAQAMEHAGAPDRRIVFEDPDSDASFTLSAWDASGLAAFPLWVGVVAGGWLPVDGRSGVNASIAGNPAAVLWKPASPQLPAEYSAFLEHDGRYYALSYLAADGGTALGDYRASLAGLSFPGSADVDVVPAIPTP